MSTLDELLIILGVIYLLEALVWLPHGGVAIARFLGRSRIRDASSLSVNPRGGFAVTSPLPFDDAIVTAQWPVSISPHGLFAYVATTLGGPDRAEQTEKYFTWKDVQRVTRDEKAILVNGQTFATCATVAQARFVARSLRRLSAIPAKKREPAIEQMLDRAFDRARLAPRLARFDARVRDLRVFGSLLFLLVFVAVPVLSRTVGLLPRLPYLAAAFALLLVVILARFTIVHRRYYPRRRADFWRQLLTMTVAPTYAMRAADMLAHEIAARHHPLTIAAIRCPPEVFRDFAGRVLRDTEHPIEPVCAATDADALATERWLRKRVGQRILTLVTQMGLNPPDLRRPHSAPGDALGSTPSGDAAYFCARCHAQFTDPAATCTVCHIPVVA